MDLEYVLQKKAEDKKLAERKKQEEQKAALAETERLQKQEAEESRLAGLRQSLTDIDTKIEQMQSLLSELKQAHEQAKTSVDGAKKEGQELTKATAEINKYFTNEEFEVYRTILADEGILSLDNLLQAEEYSKEEQVKSVKGLRQSRGEKRQMAKKQLRTRREAKVEARKAITAERPDVPQKLTYKDVVIDLEELIQALGNERKKIYYQMPEGQEARRQEIKNNVAKRHERKRDYYSLLDNKLDRIYLVVPEDIKDAEEFGEGTVKTALAEVWSEHVDSEVERKKKEAGLDILSQDLEALQSSESRLSEAQQAMKIAEAKRVELATHLIELCNRNPDNLKRLNKYNKETLHTYYDHRLRQPAEQVVKDYLDILDDLERRPNNYNFPEARDYINRYDPWKDGDIFGNRGSVRTKRDYLQTSIPNLDYFIDVAKKAEEFYQKQIQENQERVILPDEREKDKEETLVATKSDDWRRGEAFVYINKKTEELLEEKKIEFTSSLYKVEEEVRKKVAAMEAEGSKAKEKLKVKLEKDWAERELDVYLKEHRDAFDISTQKEQLDKLKKQAIEGEITLAVEKAKLSDRLQQNITVELSRYSDNEYFISNLDLDRERERDLEEVDRLRQELASLRNQIHAKANENKGIFGINKKKIAEELRVLQEQEKAKEQEKATLIQQINQRGQLIDQRRNEIRGLEKIINSTELGSNYTDREMTIGELVDDLTLKLQELQKKQLTPEQQQVFDELSRLKNKEETAKKNYDDLERK